MDRATKTRDVALGVVVAGTRVGAIVGRVALMPMWVAARMPVVGPALRRAGESLAADGHEARVQGRHRLEVTAEDVLASPEVEHAIDVSMAGPLTDAVARSLAEHRVVERIAEQVLASADLEEAVTRALGHQKTERLVAEALASPDLERLLVSAIESRLTVELTDRVLDSPEMQRAVDHVASSPEVRAALARQTTTLADEMVGGIRSRAERVDDAAERTVRGWLRRPPLPSTSSSDARQLYAGVATRAVALAIDVAIAHVIFLSGAALLGLVASLVVELRPEWLVALLLASGWTVVAGGYFVLFWTAAGQTPGMRLMRLRVARASGDPPQLGRALLRLIGLGLAIVPLFAGFLPVLFNERRRGLHDFFGDTVVVHELAPLLPKQVEIRGDPAEGVVTRDLSPQRGAH